MTMTTIMIMIMIMSTIITTSSPLSGRTVYATVVSKGSTSRSSDRR